MVKNLSHHDFHYRSRQRLFTAFLASATSLLGLGLIFALTTGFFQSVGQTTDPGQSRAAYRQDPDPTRTPTPYRKLKTGKTVEVWRDVKGFTPTPSPKIRDGDRAYYTVSMTNKGNVSLNGVKVSDKIPVGSTYIPGSASSNGDSLTVGNPITATKNVLPVGQTFQLKFTVLAAPTPGQTSIINKAVVTTSTINPPDPAVSLKIE